MAVARGEVVERAYYFGPQNLTYWELLPKSGAPFGEEVKRKPLGAVPFESRFFTKGDRLWDLTEDLSKTIRGKSRRKGRSITRRAGDWS